MLEVRLVSAARQKSIKQQQERVAQQALSHKARLYSAIEKLLGCPSGKPHAAALIEVESCLLDYQVCLKSLGILSPVLGE
jgi:hypothetical protein